MTAEELTARRNYRLQYKANAKTWLDTAGADNLGVDAVVYPGLLSDISLNDGGGGKSSFGRRDTPGAGPGIPTVVFPAGVNDNGQPINLQLLGRAWDDDKLVGMAYAFSLLADKDGKGHVAATTAPPLTYVNETTGSVGGTVPATLSLDPRRTGHVRRVHAGRREGVHGATDATIVSTAGDAALTVSEPGTLTNGAVQPAAAAAGRDHAERLGHAGVERAVARSPSSRRSAPMTRCARARTARR